MNPNHYEEKKLFRIYAMILEEEEKYVYIGKTTGRRLSAVYSRHRTGGIKATEGYFNECEIPEMYLLEEIWVSASEAYKHVVSWCHIFRQAGYAGINHERTLCQADDLLPETISIVEILCREELNQILRRTYLSNPAEGDLPADLKVTPAEKKKDCAGTSQMNIRIRRRDKELFAAFCKRAGLAQREGFEVLLDGIPDEEPLSHLHSLLEERGRKISALERENQTLKANFDTWNTYGKNQREFVLEKNMQFLRDGIRQYLQHQFPDFEKKSSLPESTYRKYMRRLPLKMKYQYPDKEGFLILRLEAILWGKSIHRTSFLLGTGEDGQPYKLRCYPRTTHAGLFPRESSYAFTGARWFIGCQRSQDGAMDLTAAFPMQWEEETPQDPISVSPEPQEKKESLDSAIRKAERQLT